MDKNSIPKKEEKEILINDLKKKLEECEKKSSDYLAGWQRAKADFINYKKQELKRLEDFLKYAEQGFLLNILPILDNFEITEKKLPEELKDEANVKGMLQIKNQIIDFLKTQGIEEIKSVGEKFDPNFHEAVEQIKEKDKEPGTIMGEEDKSSSSTFPSGQVIEEVQKGYKINGQLLRPAKVKVAN
jgi:molecular chaperone GrpE